MSKNQDAVPGFWNFYFWAIGVISILGSRLNGAVAKGRSRQPGRRIRKWMHHMWSKMRIALPIIPGGTFIMLFGVSLSGIDSGGDLPGLLRLFVIVLSVAVWSLLFSVSMVGYAIKKRHFWLLVLGAGLLAARIVFFSELRWGNSENHYYLWLPVEYLVFYFTKHVESGAAKLRFTLANAGLYALCLLVFGKVLLIL